MTLRAIGTIVLVPCALESTVPQWPAGEGWPDYFMFGDPHANYYEGQVPW
jgi:hypothetical protein